MTLAADVNRDLYEDEAYQGPGSSDIRKKITVGKRTLRFEEGIPGGDGQVHTMLAANGNLFVVTLKGHHYCFTVLGVNRELRSVTCARRRRKPLVQTQTLRQ